MLAFKINPLSFLYFVSSCKNSKIDNSLEYITPRLPLISHTLNLVLKITKNLYI